MSWIKNFFNKIRHSYYGIGKVIAFLVAIGLVWWQMPRTGKFKYEYQLSKPWQHETLYAPFDFPIYKSYETLSAETEVCPNCGGIVLSGVQFCPACGHPLETKTEAEDNTVVCPACGQKLPAGATFCTECGEKL